MNYIEIDFTIKPLQPASDILLAELGELDFDSFIETDYGLKAYILEDHYNPELLKYASVLTNKAFSISHKTNTVEQVNWNAAWEKSFSPIVVGGRCRVRAPFHHKGREEFDIVIEPKMSFGTGHHETTFMMIEHILNLNLDDQKLLDMGCGTAVLAILSEMSGAKPIDAIDIDEWCFLNSEENIERNNCKHISAIQGDVQLLEKKNYDVILANINRNILLDDMKAYSNSLINSGTLILSGFYLVDLNLIKEACKKNGLEYDSHLIKSDWVAAKFTKTTL